MAGQFYQWIEHRDGTFSKPDVKLAEGMELAPFATRCMRRAPVPTYEAEDMEKARLMSDLDEMAPRSAASLAAIAASAARVAAATATFRAAGVGQPAYYTANQAMLTERLAATDSPFSECAQLHVMMELRPRPLVPSAPNTHATRTALSVLLPDANFPAGRLIVADRIGTHIRIVDLRTEGVVASMGYSSAQIPPPGDSSAVAVLRGTPPPPPLPVQDAATRAAKIGGVTQSNYKIDDAESVHIAVAGGGRQSVSLLSGSVYNGPNGTSSNLLFVQPSVGTHYVYTDGKEAGSMQPPGYPPPRPVPRYNPWFDMISDIIISRNGRKAYIAARCHIQELDLVSRTARTICGGTYRRWSHLSRWTQEGVTPLNASFETINALAFAFTPLTLSEAGFTQPETPADAEAGKAKPKPATKSGGKTPTAKVPAAAAGAKSASAPATATAGVKSSPAAAAAAPELSWSEMDDSVIYIADASCFRRLDLPISDRTHAYAITAALTGAGTHLPPELTSIIVLYAKNPGAVTTVPDKRGSVRTGNPIGLAVTPSGMLLWTNPEHGTVSALDSLTGYSIRVAGKRTRGPPPSASAAAAAVQSAKKGYGGKARDTMPATEFFLNTPTRIAVDPHNECCYVAVENGVLGVSSTASLVRLKLPKVFWVRRPVPSYRETPRTLMVRPIPLEPREVRRLSREQHRHEAMRRFMLAGPAATAMTTSLIPNAGPARPAPVPTINPQRPHPMHPDEPVPYAASIEAASAAAIAAAGVVMVTVAPRTNIFNRKHELMGI